MSAFSKPTDRHEDYVREERLGILLDGEKREPTEQNWNWLPPMSAGSVRKEKTIEYGIFDWHQKLLCRS